MYSREEIKILSTKFWNLFGKRCEIHPQLKTKKRKWILHQTKISNVDLKFDAGRKNAQVMIEISHKNETKRLQVFEVLKKYKSLLEEGFENDLIWEFLYTREDSGKEVCRIYTKLVGVDFHRQDQWPDIFNFFIENMLILERNFLEIKEILKEDIKHIK
ncbi:MAG: DUF4268 domain-containing protein [Mariniphaga sp.]|nr:DUF4268 domain-containing protein [Mariniphaga sp.]